jgi:hypothetical protein
VFALSVYFTDMQMPKLDTKALQNVMINSIQSSNRNQESS